MKYGIFHKVLLFIIFFGGIHHPCLALLFHQFLRQFRQAYYIRFLRERISVFSLINDKTTIRLYIFKRIVKPFSRPGG